MTRVTLVTGRTEVWDRPSQWPCKRSGIAWQRCIVATRPHVPFSRTSGIPIFRWDVADRAACAAGLAALGKELRPVEILVNNACITRDGIAAPYGHRAMVERPGDEPRLGINMSRYAIGGMRQRGYGRIVNISSMNGQKGQICRCNYAAAKAGILGFTRTLTL
jgi:acetoacetyl-CoA reductase